MIELLEQFGAVAQSGGRGKKLHILAAQGGDEAVVQLLLKSIDVNGAYAKRNTAVHSLLRLPRLLCPQQIRILLLLLDHGARVSQKNRVGLTAFHIAAGNGNSEALEILILFKDRLDVQYKTKKGETPLFFAVRNGHKKCAELLLTWGANSEVLNLRRQRAIGLATSQDMRYILLNPTTVSLINHASPKCLEYPSVHGTTCIGWVLEDEKVVVLGCDSRSTSGEDIVSNTHKKFKLLTPTILAVHAGTAEENSETCEYVKYRMSGKILSGTDPDCILKLGKICLERKVKKGSSFNLLIGGIQNEEPKLYNVYKDTALSDEDWVHKHQIGCGGVNIRKVLKAAQVKLFDQDKQHDIVSLVAYLLLLCSLCDPYTGGILCVLEAGKHPANPCLKKTVIELMIQFYESQLSYVEQNAETETKPITFQQSESQMVFLFYKLEEISRLKVQDWLKKEGAKKKIEKYGHPLTELEGGYYCHQVKFASDKARKSFFRSSRVPQPEMKIPFTSTRTLIKYFDFKEHKLFVALQTVELLGSLNLSEAMNEKHLVPYPSISEIISKPDRRLDVRDDHVNGELVLSIEKLQEAQDDLEKVSEEANDKVLEAKRKYNEGDRDNQGDLWPNPLKYFNNEADEEESELR